MSTFKIISALILSSLVVGYFIYPNPEIKPVDPTQLPWHIELDEHNNSAVFGLKFDSDTLKKAIEELGEPDEMALYADPENPTIEVFFGKVTKAGLAAKAIITLAITTQQANEFLQNANNRMQSEAQIAKLDISAADRHKTEQFMISSLTYTPQYSGLDQDYLLQRFGKPDFSIKLSESASQFFYKTKGLSIISDSEGKELFQYTHPANLHIPPQAVAFE